MLLISSMDVIGPLMWEKTGLDDHGILTADPED